MATPSPIPPKMVVKVAPLRAEYAFFSMAPYRIYERLEAAVAHTAPIATAFGTPLSVDGITALKKLVFWENFDFSIFGFFGLRQN